MNEQQILERLARDHQQPRTSRARARPRCAACRRSATSRRTPRPARARPAPLRPCRQGCARCAPCPRGSGTACRRSRPRGTRSAPRRRALSSPAIAAMRSSPSPSEAAETDSCCASACWTTSAMRASSRVKPNTAAPAARCFCRQTLAAECCEPALGFDRGHAAGAGGGHGLAVDVVLHVAGGEHAFDAGLRGAGLGADVAVLVELELTR